MYLIDFRSDLKLGPGPDPRIRIRIKMKRIRNTGIQDPGKINMGHNTGKWYGYFKGGWDVEVQQGYGAEQQGDPLGHEGDAAGNRETRVCR